MVNTEEEVMKTLTGKFKHYCWEWDEMAIDETFPEFEHCLCFNDEKGFKEAKIKASKMSNFDDNEFIEF